MNTQNKKTYYIRGMHCRSCELLLERNIGEVLNVQKVEARHSSGTVAVFYGDDEPRLEEVERAVIKSGYSFGTNATFPWISKNSKDYFDLAIAGAILFTLYIAAKIFGVTEFSPNFGGAPTFPVIIIIGLTAGISTCMALVGGLVLGISARHSELHPETGRWEKFKSHLFFNAGRLMAFAALGGAIGVAGSAFRISDRAFGLFVLIVGVVMLFLGVKLTELFPRFSNRSLTITSKFGKWFGMNKAGREYSHTGTMISGALTFFLPCGFTQAMQLYAISTGNFYQGALVMFFFALGTMPGLLGVGGLTSMARGAFAKPFFKFVGIAVVFFALTNITNGFTLSGFTLPKFTAPRSVSAPAFTTIKIENGKQVVEMTQYANGYSPNRITIKKGIPVKWVVNATNLYSCSNTVVIPALKTGIQLHEGTNVLEFIAPETGELRFSCAMGMYGGYFDVVE